MIPDLAPGLEASCRKVIETGEAMEIFAVGMDYERLGKAFSMYNLLWECIAEARDATPTAVPGGFALPRLKGALRHPLLLVKVLLLLMSLTLMMPSNRPKDPQKRYLKVKMTLYMIIQPQRD